MIKARCQQKQIDKANEEEEFEEPEKDEEYEKQHKQKIQDFVNQFLNKKVHQEPTKEEIEQQKKMEMTYKIKKCFEEPEKSEYSRFTHNSDGILPWV